MDDDMIISKILCCLPPSYRAFLSAWDSVEADRQTLVYLQERLIKEEKRLSPEEGEVITAFASLNVNNKPKWNSNSQPKERPKGNIFKCYKCNRPGHIARNCHRRSYKHHNNEQRESIGSKQTAQSHSNSTNQNNALRNLKALSCQRS